MDGQNIQTSDSKEIPCDTDIDGFKLLGRGIGIDEKEFYIITHSAADCLNKKISPLSDAITKQIKKGFDFSLSIVTGNDFLSFLIGKFRFQVCRLRD